MAIRLFEANVRHAPGVAIMDLHGELDGFADEALNTAYAEASVPDPGALLLNFADVDYINSTGIALIVGLLAQARKAHRRLLTCGLSDHYVEIFKITRLADFMSMFADEASALGDITGE